MERKPDKNNPSWLIIHHAGGLATDPEWDSSGLTIKQIDDYHKQKWPYFVSQFGFWAGYHYIITKDGRVTQTRPNDEEGAHTVGLNTSSIGICLTGNFSRKGKNGTPNEEQKISFANLASELMKKYDIPLSRIVPHRVFGKTSCYGKNLMENWARNQVALRISTEEIKIKLLREKISLIEKLIQIYTILLRQMKASKSGRVLGGFGSEWHEAQ